MPSCRQTTSGDNRSTHRTISARRSGQSVTMFQMFNVITRSIRGSLSEHLDEPAVAGLELVAGVLPGPHRVVVVDQHNGGDASRAASTQRLLGRSNQAAGDALP